VALRRQRQMCIRDSVNNGASNHILLKAGMTLVENYNNNDGITWNWWKMNNPNNQ
jgi:hypothetical protein